MSGPSTCSGGGRATFGEPCDECPFDKLRERWLRQPSNSGSVPDPAGWGDDEVGGVEAPSAPERSGGKDYGWGQNSSSGNSPVTT